MASKQRQLGSHSDPSLSGVGAEPSPQGRQEKEANAKAAGGEVDLAPANVGMATKGGEAASRSLAWWPPLVG
jgi:hypothetical protein